MSSIDERSANGLTPGAIRPMHGPKNPWERVGGIPAIHAPFALRRPSTTPISQCGNLFWGVTKWLPPQITVFLVLRPKRLIPGEGRKHLEKMQHQQRLN